MLDKNILRAMAEAERMMDEGKLPFVMAPSPSGGFERLAVSQEIMNELNLEHGQRINTMLMDGIIRMQIHKLVKNLEDAAQKVEDVLLDPDFDFREEMNK